MLGGRIAWGCSGWARPLLRGTPVQLVVLCQVQIGLSVRTLVESASELVIVDTSRRIRAVVATIEQIRLGVANGSLRFYS